MNKILDFVIDYFNWIMNSMMILLAIFVIYMITTTDMNRALNETVQMINAFVDILLY